MLVLDPSKHSTTFPSTASWMRPLVDDGSLVHVLADWCAPFPGYHLYYPSRRQPAPAFTLLVEALRHRGEGERLAQCPPTAVGSRTYRWTRA